MRKVFGIGETILDIIFRNDQPQKAVPGGSVFNGLISLGRLNVPVSFISELGNDRVGDMIRDFMEDNHITTEFVDRFPDGKSPISLAFLDDDKYANYIFYKDYPAQRLEVPLPKIEKDDIFVFGSYYSLNPVLRTRMVEFLQYAQERKAIIYYDPNFRKAHAHEAIRLMPTVLENLELYQNEQLVKIAYEICRWHHERYDGRGYPDGLKGDDIPISAQVVSLADVYDALTSKRVYKAAFSHEKAMEMILGGECGIFNPMLLECLVEIQDKIQGELEKSVDKDSYLKKQTEGLALFAISGTDKFFKKRENEKLF